METQNLPHNHNNKDGLMNIKKELENISDFQIVSEIFRQLGDVSRLRIFWLLCHCEECVSNISILLNMSSPAVSHHLRILKSNKLLVSWRSGKEVLYKASDSEQSNLLHIMIEKSMEISCPKRVVETQEELIHEIHNYLLEHIDKKITIEFLSKKFAINTTSLKESFKKIYGTSLAAHIKEHRMELAAKLLSETNHPISVISSKVGFESQSKFSTAFKEHYGMLPSNYRKTSYTKK